MPQFFEWIMSNFFIVIIIVGALLSVFGKKNAKPNGSGEPFGGRAASRQNPSPRQAQLSGGEQERRSPFAGAPARAETTERKAGSGKRQDPSAGRSSRESASRGMNAEIKNRLNEQRRTRSVENAAKEIERAVGRSEFKGSETSRQKTAAPSASASRSGPLSASSNEELRKGVLWAEILGAPRSRKPHSSGRR